MTHGSLFSGIGGFDLAAEWMGWENVFHCEYDPFCQKVLKHHFPNSKLYEDIKTFKATKYRGRIDILTGGFPCQPFSAAGLRKGTEDERNLWGEMLRIIQEVSPRYVVGENVRGLLNWSGGVQFEQVCADMETEGYQVTPYLLPAASKNAPHRRDRIWFIAYRDNGLCEQPNEELCTRGNATNGSGKRTTSNTNITSTGTDVRRMPGSSEEIRGGKESFVSRPLCSDGDAPDTISIRQCARQKRQHPTQKWTKPSAKQSKGCNKFPRTDFETFPTQSPLCGGDDGLPKELDGITFPKWRKESIKAYGNAIVPAVSFEIFKAIQKMEESFVS